MLLRLLSYMIEIWQLVVRQWEDNNTPASERKLPLIIPFVFYTGSQEWKEPLKFAEMFEVPEGLEGFVPSWETLFLHLGKTPSEVLLGQMSRMGYVLSVLQVEKGGVRKFREVLEQAWEGLEGLEGSEGEFW